MDPGTLIETQTYPPNRVVISVSQVPTVRILSVRELPVWPVSTYPSKELLIADSVSLAPRVSIVPPRVWVIQMVSVMLVTFALRGLLPQLRPGAPMITSALKVLYQRNHAQLVNLLCPLVKLLATLVKMENTAEEPLPEMTVLSVTIARAIGNSHALLVRTWTLPEAMVWVEQLPTLVKPMILNAWLASRLTVAAKSIPRPSARLVSIVKRAQQSRDRLTSLLTTRMVVCVYLDMFAVLVSVNRPTAHWVHTVPITLQICKSNAQLVITAIKKTPAASHTTLM
jgi:hypothetical protein